MKSPVIPVADTPKILKSAPNSKPRKYPDNQPCGDIGCDALPHQAMPDNGYHHRACKAVHAVFLAWPGRSVGLRGIARKYDGFAQALRSDSVVIIIVDLPIWQVARLAV